MRISESQRCKSVSVPRFKGQLGVALCDLLCTVCPQGSLSLLLPPCAGWPLQVVLHCPHSDEACTCGQLVVASRESQYKIFHFHHGGLDKLSEVFQQWKYCTETHLKDQVPEQGSWCFTRGLVCCRNEALSSCHQVRQEAARGFRWKCKLDSRSLLDLSVSILSCSTCGIWGRSSRRLT